MTNEQPEQLAVAGVIQWVDLGAIRFGVPGVPYSVWPMGKNDDFIAEFTKAKEWADAYREVFVAEEAPPAPPPATAHQNPQGQRVNPNAAPTAAPPPQQPPAGQGGAQGGREEQWPPSVVDATDDDGNRVPGCSYHKLANGAHRPMRFFEKWGRPPKPFNSWKCTGQTGKTDDGYCSLIHTPEQASAPATDGAPMPVEPDARPF